MPPFETLAERMGVRGAEEVLAVTNPELLHAGERVAARFLSELSPVAKQTLLGSSAEETTPLVGKSFSGTFKLASLRTEASGAETLGKLSETFPDAVLTAERLAQLRALGVKTSDPLRTLVRMNDYGNDPEVAAKFEEWIARGRDGITSGAIKTRSELEHTFAQQYLEAFRFGGYKPITEEEMMKGGHVIPNYAGRSYKWANIMGKHKPYEPRIMSLFENGPRGPFLGDLNGQKQPMASVMDIEWEGINWQLPQDRAVIKDVMKRSDDLFADMQATAEKRSGKDLAQKLDRAAEYEWWNAQSWRWRRGTAGISQLEARTWLEVGGVDSGRFKVGVDPNLEALTSDLKDYRAAYPSFFEHAPTYFK